MLYGSTLHIPLTNLLLLAVKQEPHKKDYLLTKKFRRMDKQAEKKDKKSNRIRQKNKKVDSKVELNNSPEIPDRGASLWGCHMSHCT